MMSRTLRRFFIDTAINAEMNRQARNLTLKSVRSYIQTVKNVRLGVMGATGLILFLSAFAIGLSLVIGALVSFLPIEARTGSWIALIVGAILTVVGIVALVMAFDEKRWLEMSKSYEMMNAALSPEPVEASYDTVKKIVQRGERKKPQEVVVRDARVDGADIPATARLRTHPSM